MQNQIWIVITAHQLIQYEKEFHLVTNQSENGNYTRNLVQTKTRFRKDFSVCDYLINDIQHLEIMEPIG